MSTIRIRRSMNLAALGFVSAAVGVVAWAWLSIPQLAPTYDPTTSETKATGKESMNDDNNDDSMTKRQALIASDLWSRPLRSGFQLQTVQTTPSYVAPKPASPPLPSSPFAATTDLGLRLVGTVLEKGESMAIAVDRQGKLDFRKEGESFQLMPEGVRVENVSVDSIRVSYQGQDSTWKLGESLAIRSENAVNPEPSQSMVVPPASTPTVNTPPNVIAVPPMSIDEELDSLNGN